MSNIVSLTCFSPQMLDKILKKILSILNKNCHNSITSDGIDMKQLSKIEKKKYMTLKKLNVDLMSAT